MSRLGILLALLMASLGCGGPPTTCSGSVSYDGQPVNGTITFAPADGKGGIAAGPIKEGQYAVLDLLPGPKVVRIEAVKKVNFASTSAEMQKKAAEERKRGSNDGLVDPADTIPANADGNNANVDLKPGENRQDFALKKPAKKA